MTVPKRLHDATPCQAVAHRVARDEVHAGPFRLTSGLVSDVGAETLNGRPATAASNQALSAPEYRRGQLPNKPLFTLRAKTVAIADKLCTTWVNVMNEH